ncbi:MBL fold metallo-hydrolase [Sphingomonas cavernae]|uniref:Zn-dependent hydrolase n=1 Tax=Sphingomonas cavernae TaxID=2320861 RepID=A0A418WKA7_9SPHN|nr:MBL fold metallo-hydrolase [Sphingomonas cavernae]RJF90372.1 Zn-dependent hydrolase [Sphingomonas cavernae]
MPRIVSRPLKWTGVSLLFILIGLCLAITLIPPFLDRVYYAGPASAHFDGERFFNPDGEDTARPPTGGSRAGFFARWLLADDGRPPWPARVAVTPAIPATRVEGDQMVATWVGHATVLIQTQGLNILTDPIWSDVAGPFNVAGPRRVAAPGIRFEDLPPIDLVLVSHNHYDHMDLPTLKKLWDRDRPLIVTSLGNDTVIRGSGAEAKAVDWGTRLPVKPGIDVVVTRNHHWGSRWGTDRNRALWSSFTVITPAGNIFFAGDTGPGDMKWPAEAAKYGPVRLAIIPIGAFRFEPGQMMTGSHIGPKEAVDVFAGLGASNGLPIHWGTFRLSYEAYDTPPRLLELFARCAGYAPGPFAARAIGQSFDVPPYAVPARATTPENVALCEPGSRAIAALR